MPSPNDSPRIVIVGATTLRGKELVDLLKERIPSADLKLLDEEIAAGIDVARLNVVKVAVERFGIWSLD